MEGSCENALCKGCNKNKHIKVKKLQYCSCCYNKYCKRRKESGEDINKRTDDLAPVIADQNKIIEQQISQVKAFQEHIAILQTELQAKDYKRIALESKVDNLLKSLESHKEAVRLLKFRCEQLEAGKKLEKLTEEESILIEDSLQHSCEPTTKEDPQIQSMNKRKLEDSEEHIKFVTAQILQSLPASVRTENVDDETDEEMGGCASGDHSMCPPTCECGCQDSNNEPKVARSYLN